MTKVQQFTTWWCFLLVGGAAAQVPSQLPPPGPPGQAGKRVAFIAADFRNGGVMGVYRGLELATKTLGWTLELEDGRGAPAAQAALLNKAIAARVHGLVLGGFDAEAFRDQLAEARQRQIALVGWHAAKDPGPTSDLFVNVATRSEEVAAMAVDLVLGDAAATKRPLGVVIFNDNQFAVANAKTAVMHARIQACQGYKRCRVLAVEQVPISDAGSLMADRVHKLATRYGAAWTYSLAINDVYFDEMNFPLRQAQRTDIRNVAAGDGSAKAIARIRAGVSQQLGTVAEPLTLQGYQLADELNRAFAGAPPSGFQSRPLLLTTPTLRAAPQGDVESGLGFAAAYTAHWRRK